MLKQFTVVVTFRLSWLLSIRVFQFVGGSGPRLPKYNVLIGKPVSCPVALYSPLIATSPGKHDTVELALKETKIYYCQKIEFITCRFLLFHI